MAVINLNVKTIEGKDSVVRVDAELSLDHLRDAIEAATGIPKNEQRLIFRGRILKDELRSLCDQGFVDGLAVHVVTKPPPVAVGSAQTENGSSSEASQTQQQSDVTVVPQITTQNLIVGQVLLERTPIFDNPTVAMDAVSGALEEIREAFQLETEASLQTIASNENFAINVVFRGMREQIVDGPARERFESLKVEVKKLAWLVALVEAQFVGRIDAIFSNAGEPSQREAYQAIGDILNAMHSFDHFDEAVLKRFTQRDEDQELITLIRELDAWKLTDDEAHLQTLNRSTIVRHCLSMDLSRLLVILSMVEAKINEHLMSRFNFVLSHQHNLQPLSYAARLMNCFSSAVSRIQHARAHIYHSISDIGVHVDDNGMNRLFPQLLHYERATEPPRADITLTFIRPRATPSHSPTSPWGFSSQSQHSSRERRADPRPPPVAGNASRDSDQRSSNTTPLNSLLSGFVSIAQQLLGGNQGTQNPRRRSATAASSSSSRQNNTTSSTGHLPRPILNAMNQRQRTPIGLTTLNWNQTPPGAPNALFVGPRPPFVFPIFTIDPFLTCSSRRYRVFESDSRHNDFWNDPETVRLGIRPPSNSVTASVDRQHNWPSYPFTSTSDDNLRDRVHFQNQLSANMGRAAREFGGFNSIGNPSDQQPPTEHGEAVFSNVDDFARFVRQIFHSIAQSMAQNDSSIVPPGSSQIRNGFTANSRVSGFSPLIVHPSSSRESDELFMNIGATQGVITIAMPSEGNRQPNTQQPPTERAHSEN